MKPCSRKRRRLVPVTIFLLFIAQSYSLNPLHIVPSFVLVNEDSPIGSLLPVSICPPSAKIISGDPTHYFSIASINSSCAALRLNQQLDADTFTSDGSTRGQSFSLVIAGPKKSRATLDIQVVDVNDNPPVFDDKTPTSVNIRESANIGDVVARINTIDPDTGVSGVSRFSIDNDVFELTKRTCSSSGCTTTLKLAKKLDYESQKSHTVTVTAKDGDPNSNRTHSVSHTITVNVIDEQDEKPRFLTSFDNVLEMGDDVKIGDEVIAIQAEDGDETNRNPIEYELDNNDYLTIDREDGIVRLIKSPPMDEIISIGVKALEKNNPEQNTSAKIKFIRKSIGSEIAQSIDEPTATTIKSGELCEKPAYEAKLEPGTAKFQQKPIIKLTNEGDVRLIGGDDLFDIRIENKQLELIVKNEEEVQTRNLDGAKLLIKSAHGQCSITIKSEPVAVSFEKDVYHFSILENTSVPVIIGEIKTNSGEPLNKTIISDDSDHFDIENDNLLLVKPVDREQQAKYELLIRAETSGNPIKVPVTVNILDVNDNSPKFDSDEYHVEIDEGKSTKININVTDADEGKNGQVTLKIMEIDETLPIVLADGVLFIGAIDREALNSSTIELTLQAADNGRPSLMSEVPLIIKVKDLNDNAPKFANSRFSIVLDANISPGGIVARNIGATDDDATSPNNYVRHETDNSTFRVSDNGDLLFVGPGVFGRHEMVSFNVTALDGGNPQLSSIATVVINEHHQATPVELVSTLSQDNETTQTIHWLNERMPGYRYAIKRAQADGFDDEEVMKWLKIDAKTGLIETNRFIDPLKVKKIRLNISMKKGKREVPVELIIKVESIVDETLIPVYNATKSRATIRVAESTTVGTVLASLPADNDRDEFKFKNQSQFRASLNETDPIGTTVDLPYPLATGSKSDSLFYSIVGNNSFFEIDQRESTIKLKSDLDYNKQKSHSFTIRCSADSKQEVFAAVLIDVIPIKDQKLLNLSVSEDSSIGDHIGHINSSLPNLQTNDTLFKVKEKSIVVAAQLTGLAGQRICSKLVGDKVSMDYCVTIYPAKDSHRKPLILSPKPNSIHYFDENVKYEELLRVRVLDDDKSPVVFRLDETFKRDWTLFSIDSSRGVLKSNQPFDFEKKNVHELKVLACRDDECSSTHLFISVNDRNDNCPLFPKQTVRLSVIENEKGYRQIGRIPSAHDADYHPDNTRVCYTTDSPLFEFTNQSIPILSTTASFDREQRVQHQVLITAYDCQQSCHANQSNSTVNSTLIALIDVIDVNDNFPKFDQKHYQTTIVQSDVSQGEHVIKVSASDPDEEPGLLFSLRGAVNGKPIDELLKIDKATGEITSNVPRLEETLYSFTVAVVDAVGHEDTASVVITVVTLAQQAELIFDAPFDLIASNEKEIASELSNATGLRAIIDRCRQGANFTLVVAHFIDDNDQFVSVDRAIRLVMSSERRALRSVYGMRDVFVAPHAVLNSRVPIIIACATLGVFTITIVSMCVWCRQRNNFERKLRHISAQASHTVTLGRENKTSYGDVPMRQPAPTMSLQSTEL